MGCHIDGFIAVVAHTHVLQEGPVTGRAADVIAAANTAAEVALRLVRPGKKVTYCAVENVNCLFVLTSCEYLDRFSFCEMMLEFSVYWKGNFAEVIS